jgi:malonate-semialdehyde dehydrogenase (acetylating)/methylmalonate-semialdehyde dehydrogenase
VKTALSSTPAVDEAAGNAATGAVEPIPHLIGGRARPGASGRTAPVFNPATGQQTGELPLAGVGEVDRAIQAAAAAFEEWRGVSVARRTKLMFAYRNLVAEHAEEVAKRLTAEHGKVLADAMGEVARGLENIEYACGLAEHLKGTYNEQASTGVDVYSVRRPLGVVAGITPFNFPAMVPLWMFPNAVACGNTFVLKPSPRDPSAANFIAELFHEAGFPAGVLNVVHGDHVAVNRLLKHPDVQAVSFVGSTPVARHVYETATAHGKRAQALGGAKNHMVVLPDADIDLAADSAVSAAYGSAGERCMAISVAVAVGESADPLVDAIRARMEKLRIGPGDDPASEMGPLITAEHRDRVADYVRQGAEAGARVVVDGRDVRFEGDGFFLGVTLLDRVTPDMSVYRDEIFGPVLCVVRADTYHDAVDLLRRNSWGNGAAIFTRDGGAARQFQEDADAGMVGLNVPIPVPVGYHSFGGWKESAFGAHAIYGPEGVHFYTKPKVMTTRWPDPAGSRVDLGFPTNR